MLHHTSEGRKYRILAVVDEYTRESLAIDVARRMNHETVMERLAELFVTRGVPDYIRSDNVLNQESRLIYQQHLPCLPH